MTWRALFRRLWRLVVLRFRNFHECPECGVPMVRAGIRVSSVTGKVFVYRRCVEDNCARSRAPWPRGFRPV